MSVRMHCPSKIVCLAVICFAQQAAWAQCPGTGDCYVGNGTPGCDNTACCEAVCAADPFCCDFEWDDNCATDAGSICGPVGACCLPTGCVVVPQIECSQQGGTFQGGGTDCSACLGACCMPFDGCLSLEQADCESQGGTFQGIGVACTPALCAPKCFGDLDGDGNVATGDLLALLAAWGLCDTCDSPGTCGGFSQCSPDPNCFCLTLFDGTAWCGSADISCGDLQTCPDGNCPPGFVCVIDTCCTANICLPESSACPGAASAVSQLRHGDLTPVGIAGVDFPIDGGGGVAANDNPDCPGDLDGDLEVSTTDLLLFLGAWGACPPVYCGAPGAGNCFINNATPFCNEAECCEIVCALDAFCCDTSWDQICADDAANVCNIVP